MGDVIEILTTATNTVEVEAQGPQGAPGVGVPTGGSALQILRKKSNADYDTEWATGGGGGGVSSWNDLTDKPATFPPSAHTHPISEVTNLQTALDGKAATNHTHVASNVTDFNSAAAAAAPVQSVAGRTGAVTLAVGDVSNAVSTSRTISAGTGLTGGGDLTVNRTLSVSFGSSAGTVAEGNDSRLSDSRNPLAHKNSHATGGSDSLAPSDIGAQSIFSVESLVLTSTTRVDLEAGRAKIFDIVQYAGDTATVRLPETNALNGDVFVFRWGTGSNTVQIESSLPPYSVIATVSVGQQIRCIKQEISGWSVIPVDTHTHAATDITSGTLDIARLPTGTGSTQVALGNHTHELTALAATGASANHVLTANGSGGASFAALPASGVTGAASSASDVLGVSGSDITGVDANADRIIFFDDSAGKLTHLEVGSGLSISGTTLTATTTGTIGGSTATDNAIVRADSTANTVQESALILDDATTSTQNNVAIVNAHSETNSALVLTPKGTGAFIVGPKQDGTSTGGNARGSRAICIQPSDRSAAAQVASGTNAIAIGTRCTASNSASIAIGRSASCAGDSSVAIGNGASATNLYQVAIGVSVGGAASSVSVGNFSTADGSNAVSIGTSCGASAVRSVAIGDGVTSDLRAQFGTRAFRAIYWSGQTTNNTATILNLDGSATNRFTIAASTALAVDVLLVARRATTQDKWLVARRFLGIRRDGSNNTSLIGTVQTLGTDQSEGSPTWTFSLTADTTNHALQLEVTGASSETVEWRATAFYRVA